ncbi:MAG: hypothetical protein RRA15_02900 [bacterium]|nr:hypothetical protein [bacterium]MDT8365423.1 hypothetical protein [bacterium]
MKNLKYIFVCLIFAVAVANCSTANQDSPLSLINADGKHPGGWVSTHRGYALPDGSLCMDCHGDDLAGGISGVSCSSDMYNGQSCHASGPAFHPADWVTTHGAYAAPDGSPCMECHGDDLAGGTSGVSCSTDSFNGQSCHAGGPAFHPEDWLNKSAPGYTFHGNAYSDGIKVNGLDCVDCHDPLGVIFPDAGKCIICHFDRGGKKAPDGWSHTIPYDNHGDFFGSPEAPVCIACHEVSFRFGHLTEDNCHNCHAVPTHDVEYLDHDLVVPTSGDFTTLCSTCHAISGTSPNEGAPECVTCHELGSPYTRTSCRSCHGNPPDTGRHNKHENEGINCEECHQGAGSGSGLNHFYDSVADVAFPTAINITYNGSSCTGDCHGTGHGDSWK